MIERAAEIEEWVDNLTIRQVRTLARRRYIGIIDWEGDSIEELKKQLVAMKYAEVMEGVE
jgi:hypothetical protein